MTTAQKSPLALPEALSSRTEQLQRALATPLPAVWLEDGPSFVEAEQPEAIARVLLNALHAHLVNRKIGYLFRESIKEKGKTTLAKASRVSGKLQHFARLDLLIEVNWDAYRFLGSEQRIALLDHELCHFDVDDDRCLIIAHDVEEFSSIVRRWGFWKLDLRLFNDAAQAGPQLELFSAAEARIAARVAERANDARDEADKRAKQTNGKKKGRGTVARGIGVSLH